METTIVKEGGPTSGWPGSSTPVGSEYYRSHSRVTPINGAGSVTEIATYSRNNQSFRNTHNVSGCLAVAVPRGMSFSQEELEILDDEARVKAYDKIRATRTGGTNGHAFLLEAHKAIEMLRKPFAALQMITTKRCFEEAKSLSRAARLSNSAERRDAYAKTVAATHLELQFGLKPLVSDIGAIASEIRERGLRPFSEMDRSVARAKRSKTLVEGWSAPYRADSNKWGYYPTIRNRSEATITATIQYVLYLNVKIEQLSSGATYLPRRLGFTWENVANTAWELTPWSWLIDYATNVGDIISAGTTDTSNLVFYAKTQRILQESTTFVEFTAPIGPFYNGLSTIQGYTSGTYSGTASQFEMYRAINRGLQPPSLRSKSLSDLPPMKWLNILAVAESNRANFRHTKF